MRRKRNIFKLGIATVVIFLTFIGIYIYTSPSRCVTDKGSEEWQTFFPQEEEYDICINKYDRAIFKDNTKALKYANKTYESIIIYLNTIENLGNLTEENYDSYLKLVSTVKTNDAILKEQKEAFKRFLQVYQNNYKRGEVSTECEFTQTFKIIDLLESVNKDENDFLYVVLVNAKDNIPEVVKLDKDDLGNQVLIEDAFYQITFREDKEITTYINKIDDMFEKLEIIKFEVIYAEENQQIQEEICR